MPDTQRTRPCPDCHGQGYTGIAHPTATGLESETGPISEHEIECRTCWGAGTVIDPVPASPPPRKGTISMPYTRSGPAGPRPGPQRRPQAAPKTSLPWLQLAAMTGDYEPEDDADMLAWMRGEASGLALYAEAIETVHETAVHGVGLDPAAMAALSDYADAAAEAGEAFASARDTFARHYAEVREFAAGGGVIPYSGRWMAGDDT